MPEYLTAVHSVQLTRGRGNSTEQSSVQNFVPFLCIFMLQIWFPIEADHRDKKRRDNIFQIDLSKKAVSKWHEESGAVQKGKKWPKPHKNIYLHSEILVTTVGCSYQ